MKRFSKKNRVCARVTASVFTLALFVLSACENFVVPALKRPVSKSNAHLTELVAQWTDDSSADPSFGPEHNGGSFTATLHKTKNEERFALYGFDEDVHLVRFTLTLNDPSEEITYETFDRVLYEKSARMDVYVNSFTGMGVIELNMLYRFDTDVYIYVGKHVYTICIQKMVRNNRIYVSKYGDGSGSMDDTTGGELRGYTPDTAFFSLKNAIDRGKLTERYDIYIVGELDNDPEMPAGDAIFVIDNTDGHRFRFWDGGGGSLKSPPDSHKRVMNVQDADVAFIDLDISGGNGVNYGGAMFIEASRAAFLRCDIKENIAADKGGAVYVADKASWRSSSSVTFSNTTVRDNTRPRPEPFGSATEGIWAGIYTKLTFENAAIHDGVYFNGEPEVGTFVISGSSYFGKGAGITLDEIIAGDYGAQIWLPNEDAKITLAGNVPAGMDTYGLAAFIDTPAPAGKQVLYEVSGNAAHLADVYKRFRISNAQSTTRIASLRGIGADGKVIASSEVHVRSDGSDLCDGLTEGSAFKSFEYAVFTANKFTAPHVKVKDMLTSANHYTGTLTGWSAPDNTNSVFSLGIPQSQSDGTIIIEGNGASSGFTAAASPTKRALKLGAYSDVTLKNLAFAGSTMAQSDGSAVSVAADARLTVAGNVDVSTLSVLIDGSAVVEGTVSGSGNTEVTGSGSLTMRGYGYFSSTGKIVLAENKKIRIDSSWNPPSINSAKIVPYQWTIGYAVLEGTVVAATSGKFAMSLVAPRDKWGIAADGKLAHTAADTILFGATLNNAAAPVMAAGSSFYLGADYITLTADTAVSDTGTAFGRAFIYAAAPDGKRMVLESERNPSGTVAFSLESAAPPSAKDAARDGLYDTGNRRAVGVLYKRDGTPDDDYVLKLDLVADIAFPVYSEAEVTNFQKNGDEYGTYTYGNAGEDAHYYLELSGAAGGNGGYNAADGLSGETGKKGAFDQVSLRGYGITYGTGMHGNNGTTYSGAMGWNGTGGGGGGGDSWVSGAGGYIIASGGRGGNGIGGKQPAGPGIDATVFGGGGGGYGGGGNQAGGTGGAGAVPDSSAPATRKKKGGNGGRSAALDSAYICAGSGGGGGGTHNAASQILTDKQGTNGGAGGKTRNPSGGDLIGGALGAGGFANNEYSLINNAAFGAGVNGSAGGSYLVPSLIKRITGNNSTTTDGYIKVTRVVTYTR
ncbi:MAG: hypothetical protein Ta2A_24160 [Treponemataceae bacterium]|nr:MAG: hypothetical protein Ta2A_24160 [Treponemataceae bacterium]